MLMRPRVDFAHYSEDSAPLRVGVLVDLPHTPQAGGHIRSWERLARAALDYPELVDLTVHFSGATAETRAVGENVRFAFEPPVFSTARLPFLSHVPDHTDLAARHPRLERALARYDVIHTTDAYFAYARSAQRVSRQLGIPIVNSVHTNTPEYARIFAAQTIERLCGTGWVGRLLIDRVALPRRIEARMLRRLVAHQRRCAAVLVSRPAELAGALERTGGRAALLPRGIDRDLFSPALRDRARIETLFGIPRDRFLVLFTGRVNRGKNVMLLAQAVRELLARRIPAHLLCAGAGDERDAIHAVLPGNATCPGYLDPETLARVYASADLFAFPSKVEECANVVLEALASGLPVLVAAEGGMGRFLIEGRSGFVLPGDDAGAWTAKMEMLAYDADCRAGMAAAARDYAERRIPSWREILTGTLLPLWRRAAAGARRT